VSFLTEHHLRTRIRNTSLIASASILIISFIVFCLSLTELSPSQAWGLLAGVRDPGGHGYVAWRYVLSILGYIVVPISIALLATGLVQRYIDSRTTTPEEAERRAAEHLAPTVPAAGTEQPPTTGTP
jgi:hypothetical protein